MHNLTALDLHYLLKEWDLKNARVDKVWHDKDVLIRFYLKDERNKILRIQQHAMFLSTYKEDRGRPSGFAMALRKHLSNARVERLEQMGFERVLRLVLHKRNEYSLFIQLFGKGDVTLTDENHTVLASLHHKPGTNYEPPQKDVDLFTLTLDEFRSILASSDMNLVRTLAIKLGLSGLYAEYVLQDWNKSRPANDLTNEEEERLYAECKAILDLPIQPSYFQGKLVPFKGDEPAPYDTFTEAVEQEHVKAIRERERERKLKPYTQKKEQLEKIISAQQENVEHLNEQVVQDLAKGEKIYEHYQEVKDALEAARDSEDAAKALDIVEDVQGKYVIIEL